MKFSTFLICLIWLKSFLISMQLPAQSPGTIDPDFGQGGILSLHWESLKPWYFLDQFTSVSQSQNTVWEALRQPDEKILVLLSKHVIRLHPDGAVDTTFSGGVVPFLDGFLSRMALQADGKIVISGCYLAEDGLVHINLRRLLADGSPDLDFGTASVVSDISTNATHALPLIQPDGKIVIMTSKGHTNYQIVRLTPEGSYDLGFGQAGVVNIPVAAGSGIDAAHIRGKIDTDGSILLANSTVAVTGLYQLDANGYDLIKLKPNGSLDNTFGTNGQVHPEPILGRLSGVEFLPDGKMLFYGQTALEYPNTLFFIIRLLPDGWTDGTFADNGMYISNQYVTDYSGPWEVSLARQPNGKLVLARGYVVADNLEEDLPFLVRLHEDGSTDPDFGVGGILRIDYPLARLCKTIPLPGDKLLTVGIPLVSSFYNEVPLPTDLFAARIFAGETVAIQSPAHAAPFQIKPNPCRQSTGIHFPLGCPTGAVLRVYNPLGKLMSSELLDNDGEWTVNTAHWAPGVYWVEVQQQERKWGQWLTKVD